MSGEHDQTGPGPENITPGMFYRHAGMGLTIYFATCQYWNNPETGDREPMPGTEAMYAMNGELPGALVLSPDDTKGSVEFWSGFYPAPGLPVCQLLIDGIRSAAGQVRIIQERAKNLQEKGAANNIVDTLQRVENTLKQVGHAEYEVRIPMELAAKDATLQIYIEYLNRLIAGIGDIRQMSDELMGRLVRGTNTHREVEAIYQKAHVMEHMSPYHPPKKP